MSRRYGGSPAGTVISIIADIAALILILCIALYLFDANTANRTVSWAHDTATCALPPRAAPSPRRWATAG